MRVDSVVDSCKIIVWKMVWEQLWKRNSVAGFFQMPVFLLHSKWIGNLLPGGGILSTTLLINIAKNCLANSFYTDWGGKLRKSLEQYTVNNVFEEK